MSNNPEQKLINAYLSMGDHLRTIAKALLVAADQYATIARLLDETRAVSIREQETRNAELPHCLSCDRPLRPAGQTSADWPGTIARASQTTCVSCYAKRKNTLTPPPEKLSEEEQKHEATMRGLDRFMQQRRQRGIPTTGTKPEDKDQ